MKIKEQCDEYMSALVSIELAVAMANKDGSRVNQVIRDSWSVIRKRMDDNRNIRIFDGLCKQPFPDGALKMLRRHLDDCFKGEK